MTDPTWPVAPTTPIFMATRLTPPLDQPLGISARRASEDGRHQPPVAAVDALEDLVGGARDREGTARRRTHDGHLFEPRPDDRQHLGGRQPIGLPTEAGERAPFGKER